MRTILFSTILLAQPVLAAGDLYIYPAEGQSDERQERDRYECYVWAVEETGFDPSTSPAVNSSELVRVPVEANSRGGSVIAGTVIGAIAGAAINDSTRGAVAGAAVGTLVGAVVEESGQRKAEAEAREKADNLSLQRQVSQQRLDSYRRAFSACLEGRNYVVR